MMTIIGCVGLVYIWKCRLHCRRMILPAILCMVVVFMDHYSTAADSGVHNRGRHKHTFEVELHYICSVDSQENN